MCVRTFAHLCIEFPRERQKAKEGKIDKVTYLKYFIFYKKYYDDADKENVNIEKSIRCDCPH